MGSWKSALARTRDRIAASWSAAVQRGAGDVAVEELEATLLQADVPARLVGELTEVLEKDGKGRAPTRQARMRELLLETLRPGPPVDWRAPSKPLSVMIVGVNGSGKTTTAAKLAHQVQQAGLRPLLGAADTFRAAGAEQLKIWAERVGCDVVAGVTGADAGAVAYDAVDAAMARGTDVLILDTAGRMHTKEPLMRELQKVARSIGKRQPGGPHETWIVLDASIGHNALVQARQFHQATPLSGVIVAKLDGSAKAGFVFGVARELQVPIRFAGLGEQLDDLAPFDAASFVDALLGPAAGNGGGSG